MWSTTVHSLDATELHARWDILSKDVRDVEVVWSPVHRDALGQLLLEQLQVHVYISYAHARIVKLCSFFFGKLLITTRSSFVVFFVYARYPFRCCYVVYFVQALVLLRCYVCYLVQLAGRSFV